MSGQPFVERQADEIPWLHCGDCDSSYDARYPHECPRWTLEQAFGVAMAVGLVIWILVVAGVWTWWPL